MSKKTVIITGAPGNLGRAVVDKFISEKYFVAGTFVPGDSTEFDYPADSFEKYTLDLTNEEDSQKFVESVILKHQNIDIAILTVGGFASGAIAETKTADITKQYKLNFETAYNIARPCFIQMIKQNSGRIFMIGSKPGLEPANSKGAVAYGLAKSLIFRLAALMNNEAKGKNVVTSVIVPSTIDTEINRKFMPDANFHNWIKPEQIADVIFYYSSDEAAALREPVIKVYNNA